MRSRPLPTNPRRSTVLEIGDFWAVPLSDGRFGCGVVLGFTEPGTHGATVSFVGGLLDWVADVEPSENEVVDAPVLDVGFVHVSAISFEGCRLVGHCSAFAARAVHHSDVRSYWNDGYPASRLDGRYVHGDPPPDWERREVSSPLTEEMLSPFTSPKAVVQFESRLTDDDFRVLGEWLIDQPDVVLRAYASYDGSIRDLEFLRYFPALRNFEVTSMVHPLTSLAGLRHLRPDLVELAITQPELSADLSILERFGALESLYLEGRFTSIDTVSRLVSLEDLTLRSVKLSDLTVVAPLQRLRALDIKLGGTRDLSLLPALTSLQYLELWMIRGLTDLRSIADVKSLQYVFLESLGQVRALPSFGNSPMLRRVHLKSMRGLEGLQAIADAPGLETLIVDECPQLRDDHFRPFIGHSTLREVTAGTTIKQDQSIRQMLGAQKARAKPWREVCQP